MKVVIFGLAVSSSWGNGHATLWRGLCRTLAARGHLVVFFERDAPYYAAHRDLTELPGGELILYADWPDILPAAGKHLAGADVGMVTSYCPDGLAATDLLLSAPVRLRAFYDLDTPVKLERLRNAQPVGYVGPRGLRDLDVVLSYTGGQALDELRSALGARRVAPLTGALTRPSISPSRRSSVTAPICPTSAPTPQTGRRRSPRPSSSRRAACRGAASLIGGAQYPPTFPWAANTHFVHHVPPAEHAAFYCSSRLTLNVTRRAMAETGYCPSGRLFGAAACGAPVVSDWWEGLDTLFEPGREVLIARSAQETLAYLREMTEAERQAVGARARGRVLARHTAAHRAAELEGYAVALLSAVG